MAAIITFEQECKTDQECRFRDRITGMIELFSGNKMPDLVDIVVTAASVAGLDIIMRVGEDRISIYSPNKKTTGAEIPENDNERLAVISKTENRSPWY